MPQPFQAKK